MRLNILAYALGVWWLQQQAGLPYSGRAMLGLAGALLAFAAVCRVRAYARGTRLARAAALCTLAVACGYGWAAWRAEARLAHKLPAVWEGRDIQLTGVVSDLPQPVTGGVRFAFRPEIVQTPGALVPERVMLSWYARSTAADAAEGGAAPSVHAGERWQLTVRLRAPHGAYNPGGFDAEAWMLESGVLATGSVRATEANLKLGEDACCRVARLREHLRAGIRDALPDSPYAGVLAALTIGDQRAIPAAQWQVFTRTGVNHLMSISGSHITMLGALIYALVLRLWRYSERLTLWLPARKAAVLAGGLAAAAYAVLSGFEVPAQRTVYMLAVVALALWSGRNFAVSTLLAAALLAVLLIDPWAVNAAGFWLSFGAVAVIFYVSSARLRGESWFMSWLRVQGAITLMLVPLTLALFGQVSLISPLANAFAIPIVTYLVVPLALAGMLVPQLPLLAMAHGVMAACAAALEWLSALPAAVWQQHAPEAWSVAAAVLGAAWLMLPRAVPARWLGVAGFLPLLLVYLAPVPPGALRLTVLDVGQGLSVVAQTEHHALVYDTGPAFGESGDAGGRVILPFLRTAGITRLDTLIVSHDDEDHSGGAATLLGGLPVGAVLTTLPPDSPRLAGHASQRCAAGQRWNWDGVAFEILHPPRDADNLKDNDLSCVLKIGAPGGGALLPGDIEKKAETLLVSAYGEYLASAVLVAPHHGSASSSTPPFVAEAAPRAVVFSAGYLNRFHHPSTEVGQRYRATGGALYRTDYDGAVRMDIGADGAIQAQTWRAARRRYWLHDPYADRGMEKPEED